MYEPKDEIAFYLMRNGERISTKWHSQEDIALFDAPMGPYMVLAFVLGTEELSTESRHGPSSSNRSIK